MYRRVLLVATVVEAEFGRDRGPVDVGFDVGIVGYLRPRFDHVWQPGTFDFVARSLQENPQLLRVGDRETIDPGTGTTETGGVHLPGRVLCRDEQAGRLGPIEIAGGPILELGGYLP